MAKNEFLKELWDEYVKNNQPKLVKETKAHRPDIKKMSELELMGYETYGVLQIKADKDPVAFVKIDYSEPTLIIIYV